MLAAVDYPKTPEQNVTRFFKKSKQNVTLVIAIYPTARSEHSNHGCLLPAAVQLLAIVARELPGIQPRALGSVAFREVAICVDSGVLATPILSLHWNFVEAFRLLEVHLIFVSDRW